MGMGQNLDIRVLDVMAKMADAVADPNRLKELKDAIANNESSAEKAGVGQDLEAARQKAREIVGEAETDRVAAQAELKGARRDAAEIRKKAQAEIAAKKEELAGKLTETADLVTANQERETALEQQAKELKAILVDLDEQKKVLNKREEELDARAKRIRSAVG